MRRCSANNCRSYQSLQPKDSASELKPVNRVANTPRPNAPGVRLRVCSGPQRVATCRNSWSRDGGRAYDHIPLGCRRRTVPPPEKNHGRGIDRLCCNRKMSNSRFARPSEAVIDGQITQRRFLARYSRAWDRSPASSSRICLAFRRRAVSGCPPMRTHPPLLAKIKGNAIAPFQPEARQLTPQGSRDPGSHVCDR